MAQKKCRCCGKLYTDDNQQHQCIALGGAGDTYLGKSEESGPDDAGL